METVEAGKPCDYTIGTVVSENPLKVKISNSLTIDEDFIDLARSVTDYEVEVSYTDNDTWNTQEKSGGGGYAEFASHNHEIKLSKGKFKFFNGLKTGEKVLMIQKMKGQKYTIIDRVVSA